MYTYEEWNKTEDKTNLCTYEEWNKTQNNSNFLEIFLLVKILFLLALIIVVSNSLVIIDIVIKKKLRVIRRKLTLSLAITDLMSGLTIFPFNAINLILKGYWIFGDLWCVTCITIDIWLYTVSIYTLTVINIDRLIAITKPLHHSTMMTHGRMRMIINAIWTGSFLLCCPSFLLVNIYKSVNHQCICIPVYAARPYTIISASLSFYVPMALLTFITTKIFIITRRATTTAPLLDATTSDTNEGKVQISMEDITSTKIDEAAQSITKENTIRNYYTDSNITSIQRELSQTRSLKHVISEPWNIKLEDQSSQRNHASEETDILIAKSQYRGSLLQIPANSRRSKSHSIMDKKLSLQIKTIELITFITGCVILCRLFFSILYGFSLNVSPYVWSVSSCMGHVNSALNPIIYFSLSRDFRNSLKKLFTRSKNSWI
ncbi:putative G-protein coupled receptor [Dirofilaria immitis]